MAPAATNRIYKIASIAGDGIGKEVLPEGQRVLEAAAKQFGFEIRFDDFDFASCDCYLRYGKMMPDDWKDQIGQHDAIFFGAVGWPDTVPDHVPLWGSLIQFRREFDQYVSLRPVKLMPEVQAPLAGRGPGDIDFDVVRENTEGEYSSIGGRIFPGTERKTALQETVTTRKGVDRILKYAFALAMGRPTRHLTSATKSNGISISMPYRDERVEEMAKAYPEIAWDKCHIDILCANFVLKPDYFDVVVSLSDQRLRTRDAVRSLTEAQVDMLLNHGPGFPVATSPGARVHLARVRARCDVDRGRWPKAMPRPVRLCGAPVHRPMTAPGNLAGSGRPPRLRSAR